MAEMRAASAVPQELDDAIDWYAARSLDAAIRFVAAVEAAFDSIVAAPERFPWWNKRFRYARVKKYPYVIAFTVNNDVVTIAGVRHTSRRNADLDD